jgi:hypothetical protein
MAKKRSATKVAKRSGAGKKAAKKSKVRKRSAKTKSSAKARPPKNRKAKAAKTSRTQPRSSAHVEEKIKSDAAVPGRPDRASLERTPETLTQKVTNVITAVFDTVAEARGLERKTMGPERPRYDEGE